MKDFFELMKEETGKELNQVQKEAVLYNDGPLLLLASPGSGKTTTLNMKIGYLILEKGIAPHKILALTFSQASARDMEARFDVFFHNLISDKVKFSTIHSFAYAIVREYFYKHGKRFILIEGESEKENEDLRMGEGYKLQKKYILRNIFKEINGSNITEDQMEELLRVLGYVKNKCIPKTKVSQVKTAIKHFDKIYEAYEFFKKKDINNILIDFDDMLVYANAVLKKDKMILTKYQQMFDYILVDESQDTSLVQHNIIEKLAEPHQQICMVGDDDQTLYSWRGAEVDKILNFKQTYPNGKILYMEQNYRSTKEIVDTANQFIKRNQKRYAKNMYTENPSKEPIRIFNMDTYEGQIQYVVEEIKKQQNLSEIAVLYRNNSSAINLINALDLAGIPFYIKDSDNKFFSHWVLKDILNFFRFAQNDTDVELFERIHKKFNGYISKKQMALLKTSHSNKSVFERLIELDRNLQGWQKSKLRDMQSDFSIMKNMKPKSAIRVIREVFGYDEVLEKTSERLGFALEGLMDILNTLEILSDSLESIDEFETRLDYLTQLLKVSKYNKHKNAITLSTFHSSKGLEFEKVFMIDLVNEIIPTENLIKDYKKGIIDEMEEMARLFYVGMTRAKTHLELLAYKQKGKEKFKESIFVTDVKKILKPELSKKYEKMDKKVETNVSNKSVFEVKAGNKISHKKFGFGEVLSVEKDVLHIQFENGIEKSLSLSVCSENQLLTVL